MEQALITFAALFLGTLAVASVLIASVKAFANVRGIN